MARIGLSLIFILFSFDLDFRIWSLQVLFSVNVPNWRQKGYFNFHFSDMLHRLKYQKLRDQDMYQMHFYPVLIDWSRGQLGPKTRFMAFLSNASPRSNSNGIRRENWKRALNYKLELQCMSIAYHGQMVVLVKTWSGTRGDKIWKH